MEKFYRNLFKRSWLLCWRNKWLWVLGLFAALLANGTLYETVIRSFSNLADGRTIFYTLREYGNAGVFNLLSWPKLIDLLQNDPSIFTVTVFGFLLFLAVVAAALVLAVVSQAAIVKAGISLDLKNKISFKQAFAAGVDKFWPVFGLNFFMRVILFGLILLVAFAVSLIPINNSILNNSVYIIAFLALLILSIIVYFLTIYSIAFIVLRDKKVFTAIRLSWFIFQQNVLINLETGLILFVINVLFGLCLVIVSLFILSPLVLIYLIMVSLSINTFSTFLVFLMAIIIFAILIIGGGWYASFHVCTWSLLFEELAMKRGRAKIVRVIENVSSRLLTDNKKKSKLTVKKTIAGKKKQMKSKPRTVKPRK